MLKKMLDSLLAIIPFDSIRSWLTRNPDVALLLFLIAVILSFVGGMYIA